MARAGNDLRQHLLQAMVQQISPGRRTGHMAQQLNPMNRTQRMAQQLGQGSSARDRLQQLLQRINGGQPPQIEGQIHGFGAGGAVTLPSGDGPQDPRFGEHMGGTENRPADVLHAEGGHDLQASQTWLQNHPGARAGNHAIPNWVLEGLTNAVNHGGLHPNHMQEILQHLSQAIGKGNPQVNPLPPGPAAPAAPGPVGY